MARDKPKSSRETKLITKWKSRLWRRVGKPAAELKGKG